MSKRACLSRTLRLPFTYLELAADVDTGDCAIPGYRAWTADGEDVRQSPPSDQDRLWILEVDGVRLMVDVAYPPGTAPEVVAELTGIVESIRFESASDGDGGHQSRDSCLAHPSIGGSQLSPFEQNPPLSSCKHE